MASRYPSLYSREHIELISECAESLRSFRGLVEEALSLEWNNPSKTNQPTFRIERAIRVEDNHVLVDLHGLNRPLARRVVLSIAAGLSDSPVGGIRIVHGVGRGILKGIALQALDKASTVNGRVIESRGWLDYIWDEDRFHREIPPPAWS